MAKELLPERDLFGARQRVFVRPADCWMGKCRSCGAPMAFVTTKQGKAMPLSLATIEEREGVRYALPHFIDCLDSKDWSKR